MNKTLITTGEKVVPISPNPLLVRKGKTEQLKFHQNTFSFQARQGAGEGVKPSPYKIAIPITITNK
jgi:hypothetical protein